MKFYDLEWLADKCGTDNKYEITAKVAAEARRESEQAAVLKERGTPADERFISNVLREIEEDKSPISVNYKPAVPVIPVEVAEVFEVPSDESQAQEQDSQTDVKAESESTEPEISEIPTEALSLNE